MTDPRVLEDAATRGGITNDARLVISYEQVSSVVDVAIRSRLSMAQLIVLTLNMIALQSGEKAARHEVALLAREGVVSPNLEGVLRDLVHAHPQGTMSARASL